MGDELNLVPQSDQAYNFNDKDSAKIRIIEAVGDFIDKLIILEEHLGSEMQQSLLEPESIDFSNTNDAGEINLAAKKIAEFMGLSNNISVNITRLSSGVAGSISPTHSIDLTINLSSGILNHRDSVLGVLAHELTHQYLFIKDINLCHKSILDNEILTDIAAIYLGLGKLILNGYKSVKTEYTYDTVITQKYEVGYIKNYYLGFVYKTVCNMRRIPEDIYKAQLNPKGKNFIIQAMEFMPFTPYLSKNFFDTDYKSKMLDTMHEAIYRIQVLLSDIEKSLKNNEILASSKIKPLLAKSHQGFYTYLQTIAGYAGRETSNSSLEFLYCMQIYQTLEILMPSLDSLDNLAKSYKHQLIDINPLTKGQYSDTNACEIICRNDGMKINELTGKPLFNVRCPSCGYEFPASTDNVLYYDKSKDFKSLYNDFFGAPKIIEANAQGVLDSIISVLKTQLYLTTGLILLFIALICFFIFHYFVSVFFGALGVVFIVIEIFNIHDL